MSIILRAGLVSFIVVFAAATPCPADTSGDGDSVRVVRSPIASTPT